MFSNVFISNNLLVIFRAEFSQFDVSFFTYIEGPLTYAFVHDGQIRKLISFVISSLYLVARARVFIFSFMLQYFMLIIHWQT